MGQSLSAVITVVENHADRQVLHLNIYYHTTLRVIDTNNTFTVSGTFPSRSGSVSIDTGPSSGAGSQWLYSQARTVNKVFGSTQSVTAATSLTGIEFWGAGQVIRANASHTVPARAPVPPTLANTDSVTNITHNSATITGITVSNNGGATPNNIRVQHNSSASTSGARVTTRGSWAAVTLTGLPSGQRRYYRVAGANSAGWSSYGPWRSFVTLPPPVVAPSAPTLGMFTNVTQTSATVNWTAPSSSGGAAISNYQVQRATNAGFTTGLSTVSTGSGASRSRSITGLTRATRYYVRVRASNGTAWSPWSSSLFFSTPAAVPTIANTHSVTNITRNSATVTGISVSNNGGAAPNNVRVQHNSSASTSGAQVTTRGAWAQAQLTGLPPGQRRHYRVAAANSAGWSSYSPWRSFDTLLDAPDDMAPPSLTVLSDTSIQANWVAPNMHGATFTEYGVQMSTSENFAQLVADRGVSGLSTTFVALTPGTRYYVRVRANAAPNHGGWGVADARTTGRTPNSGLRWYTFVAGERRQLEPYLGVGSTVRPVRAMYAHDGDMKTE